MTLGRIVEAKHKTKRVFADFFKKVSENPCFLL